MGCKLATCVFSILNEGKKSVTASGTYLIGLKKVNNECYDELQPWLSPILNLVTEFKNFESNSMRYSLEYYFGSDYKMLGEALGLLNAAITELFCGRELQKRVTFRLLWINFTFFTTASGQILTGDI
jgi:hypothetical protein